MPWRPAVTGPNAVATALPHEASCDGFRQGQPSSRLPADRSRPEPEAGSCEQARQMVAGCSDIRSGRTHHGCSEGAVPRAVGGLTILGHLTHRPREAHLMYQRAFRTAVATGGTAILLSAFC